MVCVRVTFILILCVFNVYTSNVNDGAQQYEPHISAILRHLNSNPNKIYDYRRGIFVSSQEKADIVELTIDVEVACRVNYLGIPCTEQILTCSGFLQYNDGKYRVLSDVLCKPKQEFSVENSDELTTVPVISQQESKIELSHESVSADQNADFVAVKPDSVPCLGCPFDLNTNVEGVYSLVDTAIEHIESERNQKHLPLKIIRLQQQVVAGIKYILTIEVAPTVCPKNVDSSRNCPLDANAGSSVCEVIFLEKPWVSKDKTVIRNNCTISQEFSVSNKRSLRNDKDDNEIEASKQSDDNDVTQLPIVDSEKIKMEMDSQRLADLESQILVVEPEDTKPIKKNQNQNNLNTENRFKEKIENPNNRLYANSYYNYEPVVMMQSSSNNIISTPYTKNTNYVDDAYTKLPKVTLNLNDDGIPTTDYPIIYNFRQDRSIHENNEAVNQKHDRFERELNSADSVSSESAESKESNKTDDISDESGESRTKRSIDINDLENKVEDTILSRIKRKYDDSSSSSSSSSDDKIEENHQKNKQDNDNSSSSSEDKTEEKKADDKKDNNDSSSSSSSSSESKDTRDNASVNKVKRSIGQLEKISQEEKFLVRDLADFAASSLDNIDDDNHKRIILQILGAKKLKLDGIYYHIVLSLGISQCTETEEDENCREKLFTDLTKICKVLVHVEDDLSNPKVVKSQCQNIKKDDRDRNRTNYSRYRRDILVGAPSDISIDDPRILKFTEDTLTELDSKADQPTKHKLIKIKSATSQIVAGVKYEIEVLLSPSDCLKNDEKPRDECNIPKDSSSKNCKISVWDRPWMNRQEITVKCNDSVETLYFDNNQKIRKTRSFSNKIFGNQDQLEESNTKETPENLGGTEEKSADDQKAAKYLESILTYFDGESGHNNKLKIQDILSVEKQVVAGELWRIKAKVTLSDCLKNTSVDPQVCKKLEGSESRTCLFKIWDRSWLPHGQEIQISCDNEPEPYNFRLRRNIGESKYVIPSSLENKSVPNPELLEYIKSGLEYLDSHSEYKNKYALKSIKKVSTQKTDGILWKVTAEIALSDCPKDYQFQYCDELENSETNTCHFRIWERVRLLTKLEYNITCENDKNVYSFQTDSSKTKFLDNISLVTKFHQFSKTYKKVYATRTEFNYRLKVFKKNLNTIRLLNKYEQGTGQYGITQFADMTAEEFSKSRGLRMDLRNENEAPFLDAVIPDIEIPTEFDWRKKGAVTKVKDQGSCGSCWAFSTTGNIEGQYAIKYSNLLEFSEQELVDCDKLDEGCNGGLMDNAYRTIEKIGGLETESDYPYDAEDEKCHFSQNKVHVKLSGALNISHNEDDMAKWLVKNGPISIAINANAMQFYVGGVSHPWKMLCNPKNLDHGVLIVGYGVHTYPLFNKTLPYWIVKNSWGPSWGEQGYYRVFRGDGTCGLNQTPSSAIVA